MDTIDYKAEELSALVKDVVSWLVSASSEDIMKYAKALPQAFLSTDSGFSTELFHVIRHKRNWELESHVKTNAVKILDETELIVLLTHLAQYNPESVFKKYSEYNSSLVFESVKGTVTEWSRDQIAVWKNAFRLLTSKRAAEALIIMKSVYALNYDENKLVLFQQTLQKTFSELINDLQKNNYSALTDVVTTRRAVVSLLQSNKIFSEPYIDRLVSPGNHRELISVLHDIDISLDILQALHNYPIGEVLSDDILLANIWRRLAADLEADEVRTYAVRKMKVSTDGNNATEKLFDSLFVTLTAGSLINGKAQEVLGSYVQGLNVSQKSLFLEELKSYLMLNPAFSYAFDAIDADYFFKEIHGKNTREERMQFVNSLQKSVTAEEWPLIKQLFTLIANLYS